MIQPDKKPSFIPRLAVATGLATVALLTLANRDSADEAAAQRAEGCHSITVGQYQDKTGNVVSNVPENIQYALTDPTEVGLLTVNLDRFSGLYGTGLNIQGELKQQNQAGGNGSVVMGGDIINFCITDTVISPDTQNPSRIAGF